jgi:SAM-dependent methyltransferase
VTDEGKVHWDAVYSHCAVTDVSWYEAYPRKSLELIQACRLQRHDPIIDVGGGASFLVNALLNQGSDDLTVLDISAAVLEKVRARLGPDSKQVALLRADVTAFRPAREYALWHDRAVFHFLVHAEDRARYLDALRHALRPNGYAIIATFGPEGPERCSGLPVMRYDAERLTEELGGDLNLVESCLEVHRTPSGAPQQLLYCRFQLSDPAEIAP